MYLFLSSQIHLYRRKCLHLTAASGGGGLEIGAEDLVPVLTDNLEAGDTNAMLAVAGLANLVAKNHQKRLVNL